MTREEQISEAAQICDIDCFVAGAEWADSHPNWHKMKINDNQYDLPDKSGRYLVVLPKWPDDVLEGIFLHHSNFWLIGGCNYENDEIIAWIEKNLNPLNLINLEKQFKYHNLALYCKGYYKYARKENGKINLFADFRKYLDEYILPTDADVYQKALSIATEYADLFKWDIQIFVNNVRQQMTIMEGLTWYESVLWEVYSAIQGLHVKHLENIKPDYTKFEKSKID